MHVQALRHDFRLISLSLRHYGGRNLCLLDGAAREVWRPFQQVSGRAQPVQSTHRVRGILQQFRQTPTSDAEGPVGSVFDLFKIHHEIAR